MAEKKTTMKDVARLAGVTQPTVSYVLNGTASISEEVRERVLKAVETLNYRPNYNAVALKTRRTNEIGIIIPDITNTYYSSMVSMLERELTKMGYLGFFGSTGYQKKTEREILDRFLYHNVDAFIIAYQLGDPECWKMLKNSGKKAITIEAGKAGEGFPGIEMDNHFGAYNAVKRLYEEGRRHIVYISQTYGIEALILREQGYIDAVKDFGVQKEPVILSTDITEGKWKAGTQIGEQLADAKEIDGILVSSDEIAVGLIKTLMSSGINIPGDISVIGYDNIPLAELYIPGLTTVAQPIEEVCVKAGEMIGKLMRGESAESLVLRPELIVRETACCEICTKK